MRGVDFRIRISPRIRSQNRKGLKGSVRDLDQSDLCKNIEKTGSLPCSFKDDVTGFSSTSDICFTRFTEPTSINKNHSCFLNAARTFMPTLMCSDEDGWAVEYRYKNIWLLWRGYKIRLTDHATQQKPSSTVRKARSRQIIITKHIFILVPLVSLCSTCQREKV